MKTKYQQVGYNKTLENIKFYGVMIVFAILLSIMIK